MARGSIVRRGDSWRLTVELPPDGMGKRRRLTETVAGTKKDAQRRLAELVLQADQHRLGATTRLTVAEYLDVWLRDHAATRAPVALRYIILASRQSYPTLVLLPILPLAFCRVRDYNTTMRTLSDELERIRTEHHWTHGRMAEALGIDRSTYRLFVNGRNRAGRKIIGGVARAFPQVNVAYFAARDVEMAPEAPDSSPERDDAPSEYSDTLARRSGAQGAKTEVAQ